MIEKYYTGIGSRETPLDIKKWMFRSAIRLGELGFVLRSGGAVGADESFESLCKGEIYLPYNGFNGHHEKSKPMMGECEYIKTWNLANYKQAEEIAASSHPNWKNCSEWARKLHTRNVYQVLGKDLETPSVFVLCWTKDGCENGSKTTRDTGGAGQALRIAHKHNVPIVNMFNDGWQNKVKGLIAND